MKPNKDMLEDQLESHERHLRRLSSYLQELKTTTANCGTAPEQYEQDQIETENNIKFYQAAIFGAKAKIGELAEPEPAKSGPGSILPQTAKQGIGSAVFSSITFIAGALLGSRLKSRKSSKDPN